MSEDVVKNNDGVVDENLPVYGFDENYAVTELVPVLADIGGLTYLGHLEADGSVAADQMSMSAVVQAELPIVPTQILVAVNFWLALSSKLTLNPLDGSNYVDDEDRWMSVAWELVVGFGQDEQRMSGDSMALKHPVGVGGANWEYFCANRTVWVKLDVTSYMTGDVLNVGVNTTHGGLYTADLSGTGIAGMSVDIFACGGEVV